MNPKKGQQYQSNQTAYVYTVTKSTNETITLVNNTTGREWSGTKEYIENIFNDFTLLS